MHQFIDLKSTQETRELKEIEGKNKKIIFKAKGLCECGSSAEYICPECNANVCGDHAHGHEARSFGKCLMVVGRRGWRQLGVYDG